MPDDVETTWDSHALSSVTADPLVMDGLMDIANEIAAQARSDAPRLTGEGAESIHAEPQPGIDPAVHVSWERDKYYMRFHELGAKHLPARPFLVPAADRYR